MNENIPLSTAIRLGATLKPQAFTSSHDGTSSCALQSACEALGCDPIYWPSLGIAYPWIHTPAVCPLTHGDPDDILGVLSYFDVIWHLNDKHKLSREQIADYVEQWESIEQLSPVPERELEESAK